MKAATLNRDRLQELITRFSKCRVAVVGDFFLDKYLEVDPALAEPSLETGKVAHQVVSIRRSPGAAGTVVSNLAALGAGELHAIGFTGEDGEGYELRRGLEQLGCTTKHLPTMPDRFTPTYLKPRDRALAGLEGEHSRYDTKNRTPTSRVVEERILSSLEAILPDVDAVVVLDQVIEENSGVITRNVRDAISLLASKHPGVLFWADSRRHIRQFQNAVIKPNQFEALGIESSAGGEAISLEVLLKEGQKLRQQARRPVFITRGAEGLVICDQENVLVPGLRMDGPVDPTGAGDSTTAGCVLAICAGASFAEAGIVGVLVASITVQQLSTTGTARPAELPDHLEEWLKQHRH